ncbi:uncharacterized protein F4812DRAFT_454930 [Daldinia caldariorum]|uniref:uncharacterized protein n=1 Tax=Daldinia caldariorum TaxID=326644 RepID=UPI002007896F|nr:uncharacterized protein F4812DRAFT_454930 [Daldinia caldariorum]KAI1473113.1 hypothetical protein F4812DRAFT_454930 [Daldinia caldariorum]
MFSTFSPFATKVKNLDDSSMAQFNTKGSFQLPRALKKVMSGLGRWKKSLVAYISRRRVYWAITVWGVTFIILVTLGFGLGFGPAGVIAGSLAAAFQSAMYGGFTPAGGLFAALTSLAMLGTFAPALVGSAAALALILAVVTFFLVED